MKAIKSAILAVTMAAATQAFAVNEAARLNDITSHAGHVLESSANVFINGQPAARSGDFANCPVVFPFPHIGGDIITGSSSVRINGQPAARVGDTVLENGATSTISNGSPNVRIGN